MKPDIFDRTLIAARPDGYKINHQFTDSVMNKINTSEIILSSMRNMGVTKKETFMMKLIHLPKFAIILIAVGVLVAISGTAYAAYQLLWTNPKVSLTETGTSVSGRKEVVLAISECGNSQTSRYELKTNATITADRIPAIVQAQCELRLIDEWAQSNYGNFMTMMPPTDGSPYDQVMARASMATHLESKKGNVLTFASLDTYGMPGASFTPDSNVKYIVDGKESTLSAINEGDVVAYVTTNTIRMTADGNGSYSSGGQPDSKLVAVVKLAMPFEDYDQFAWQSLSERQGCYGNVDDSCVVSGASIDLYMGGGGGSLSEGVIMKEIQGVVTALHGTTTSIRSSSGTIFNVTTPTDVIASYNQNKASQYYNDQYVKVGSSIMVQYVESEAESSKNIKASYMRFQIELISKGDPVKAY